MFHRSSEGFAPQRYARVKAICLMVCLLASMVVLGGCSTASPTATGQTPTQGRIASSVNGAANGYDASRQQVLRAPVASESLSPPARAVPPKIALILPLTGQGATIGDAMRDAAMLAVYDVADKAFALTVYDDASTAAGATQAAQNAIKDGNTLILGPLFAQSVQSVGRVAAASGIPVVGFSTDSSVAGGNVRLMGFTPYGQIERAITYARVQGSHRFAALLPASSYGNVVEQAMRDAIAAPMANARAAQSVTIIRYGTEADGLTRAIQQLRDSYASSGGFDALLIPEGGARLQEAASLLQAFGFISATGSGQSPAIRLIGSGQWDDSSVAANPLLAGAIYAAPDPAGRADFERRFTSLYNRPPHRLATLAYDATALAAVLARQSGGFKPAMIADPNGFAGIDGIFRFNAQGLAERGLAVLEITNGTARLRDVAPTAFTASQY